MAAFVQPVRRSHYRANRPAGKGGANAKIEGARRLAALHADQGDSIPIGCRSLVSMRHGSAYATVGTVRPSLPDKLLGGCIGLPRPGVGSFGRTHAIAASDLRRQGRRFLVFFLVLFLVPFRGLIPVPAPSRRGDAKERLRLRLRKGLRVGTESQGASPVGIACAEPLGCPAHFLSLCRCVSYDTI